MLGRQVSVAVLDVAVDVRERAGAAEALPAGVDPLDYPYELFRRLIYLPSSRGVEMPADPLDLFEDEFRIE